MAQEDFTYNFLLATIPSYLERQGAAVTAQIPTFITLAENRIAGDMKQLGFQSVVTGNLAVTEAMPKPVWWRENISFTILVSGKRQILKLRSLEYLRQYWPDPSQVDVPVYYGDYNYDNFVIVPTPSSAYAFELAYYARLNPLTDKNQTNWLTLNAPQVLLYAALWEANLWLKNMEKSAMWEAQYNTAKSVITGENQERQVDRTEVVRK